MVCERPMKNAKRFGTVAAISHDMRQFAGGNQQKHGVISIRVGNVQVEWFTLTGGGHAVCLVTATI